jgi:4-hydroxy-3-polyprenylbenzoate decarboxylase
MYPDLQSFISALDRAGELIRIAAPVSSLLEISEITDRISKSQASGLPSLSARKNDPRFYARGGKALLFEQVSGAKFPLLINAWGSYLRMEMALGCHAQGHTPGGFDAIGSKIAGLVKPEPPKNLRDLIAKGRQFLPLLRIPPKRKRGRGLCQEIILTGSQINLADLPILRCWPHDGDFAALGYPPDVNDHIDHISRDPAWLEKHRGKYITLSGIHTIHADDRDEKKPSSHNIGMYRVQLLGPQRLAMHWHMHHDGARHWRSWKKFGQKMPVAIALGGESIMPYAATAPLPPGISELLLAGFLNKSGIPMVRGVTVPLWVPANAEIIIEGFVHTDAGYIDFDPRPKIDPKTGLRIREKLGPGAVFEGPFGDHTGFYSMPDRYPILEVTAITHRRNAVYPTTIVGLPPQEDYYLGKATERIFMPLLKTIVHDVEDYDLPQFGAFHNCAAIAIKKAYPMQGRRMMHSIWGAGQMAWTKTIFVVDDAVNVHDTPAVLRAAATNCHPLRDIARVDGPLDILDHAAPHLGTGCKLGFDCSTKREGDQTGPFDLKAPLFKTPPNEHIQTLLAAISKLPHVTEIACPQELGFGWLFIAMAKSESTPRGIDLLEQVLTLNAQALNLPESSLPPYIIILDQSVDVHDFDEALFHWCANADAGRDSLTWPPTPDPLRPARVGFDATFKLESESRPGKPVRPWPPIIHMDAATQALVTSRWPEYGLK